MTANFNDQRDPVADFEEVWRNVLNGGPRPNLKEYLSPNVPTWAQKSLLQQLLEIELCYRRRLGEQPVASEYTAQLSDFKPLVETIFQRELESTWISQAGDPKPKPSGFSTSGVEQPSYGDSISRSSREGMRCGPYDLQTQLGEGAFGQVWLANHRNLNEQVAIKLIQTRTADEVLAYIAEAKNLLTLVHPNIVRFYHAEILADHAYIVMEYLPGGSLKDWIKSAKPSLSSILSIVKGIADGLGHAHQLNIIHRDLKPANILLTANHQPKIADFGMSTNYSNYGSGKTFAGTPNYMSPEQARGESHRVDGRTDIFALGVIFYELLTGAMPFGNGDVSQTIDRIIHSDPRPPRQLNDKVPAELERICMKCLEKKLTNRYGSTADLLEDLEAIFAKSAKDLQPSRLSRSEDAPLKSIVPRGLRAFDADDADFFLELWPGPRDRHGNPEIIRFWKSRIESQDACTSCTIGVVYGPSGSGKSSMVRAGLLPRLSSQVDVLTCIASPSDTEKSLAKLLGTIVPVSDIHQPQYLPDAFAKAREKYRPLPRKLLIVIDQFEQYLHTNPFPENGFLADALRQCDGSSVQILLIVRDDFWLSLQRLMSGVEVPLREGINISLVDRFDEKHVRKVLSLLGEAYNRLPANQALDARQIAFLDKATEILATNQKTTPIQISIFVELLKHSEWTSKSLQGLSSVSDLGVLFLEDCFGENASSRRRFHAQAAMRVLDSLTVDGTEVRATTSSYDTLLAASGYSSTSAKFDELMHILLNELRLLSPSEHDAVTANGGTRLDYILTHDFLVPSVKSWVMKRLSMTRRGRAQLLLDRRARDWQASRENRALPDFFEYAFALVRTWNSNKNPVTLQMLRRCHVLYGRRLLVVAGLACLSLLLVTSFLGNHRQELYRTKVENLVHLPLGDFMAEVKELKSQSQKLFDQIVNQQLEQVELVGDKRTRLLIAALPADHARQALNDVLTKGSLSDPALLAAVIEGLTEHQSLQADELVTAAQSQQSAYATKFQSAVALQQHALESNVQITDHGVDLNDSITVGLMGTESNQRQAFANAFPKIATSLRTVLLDKYKQTTTKSDDASTERLNLRDLLVDLYPHDSEVIVTLTERATKSELAVLLPIDYAFNVPLSRCLDEKAKAWSNYKFAQTDQYGIVVPHLDSPDRERLKVAIANLVIALSCNENLPESALSIDNLPLPILQLPIEVQQPGASPRSYGAYDRSLAGEILDRIAQVPPQRSASMGSRICERLDDPAIASSPDVAFFLLLALGKLVPLSSGVPWLQAAESHAEQFFSKHQDPGVRNAARWLGNQLSTVVAASPSQESNLVTFYPPLAVLTGSPEWEKERDTEAIDGMQPEQLRLQYIPYAFQIAATEVTNEFYKTCTPGFNATDRTMASTSDDSPAAGIKWEEAAVFCNKLSERAGIPPDQWTYDDKTKRFDITKTGYRLPTSLEWEYACRAHSMDLFAYGSSPEVLRNYAWFIQNSMKERLNPVGSLMPNRFGLFDMHGNIAEHCADDPVKIGEEYYRTARGGGYADRWSLLRSAVKIQALPDDHPAVLGSLGFRIARTLPSNNSILDSPGGEPAIRAPGKID